MYVTLRLMRVALQGETVEGHTAQLAAAPVRPGH